MKYISKCAALFAIAMTGSSIGGGACGDNQACNLFVNLTAVNPSPSELAKVEATIASQGLEAAAKQIVEEQKEFQTVRLKTFAEPWTHVDGKLGSPLNDTILTVIQFVMRDMDYRGILSTDNVAKANTTGELGGENRDITYLGDGTEIALYHPHADKKHYRDLEDNEKYHIPENVSLDKQLPLNSEGYDAAGIISTNGFAKAAFSAGTNRRAIPMILREALCLELDQLRDAKVTEKYIQRDVANLDPDGTATTYKTVCKTCHGFIDQIAPAFVFYDVAGNGQKLTYERVIPVPPDNKMLKNVVNQNGYIVPHDEWRVEEFTEAQLELLGWPKDQKTGFGAKSLGEAIANTQAFAKCQPSKAFEAVCGFKPREKDGQFVDSLIQDFKTNGYKLKGAFIKSAIYCLGESK